MTHDELWALQDVGYRDFQSALMPTVDKEKVIGIRTPILRKLAKDWLKKGDYESFLATLPHAYFEENQLHAFLLGGLKDFQHCLDHVERFLPYIDNWATCDQLAPIPFTKHKEELLPYIQKWLANEHPYTVRYAIGCLMSYFLDEDFDPSFPRMVASVSMDHYYVKMMVAWYFATALDKQPKTILPYFEQHVLPEWTHRKAIQKACESFRISPETKNLLRSLK